MEESPSDRIQAFNPRHKICIGGRRQLRGIFHFGPTCSFNISRQWQGNRFAWRLESNFNSDIFQSEYLRRLSISYLQTFQAFSLKMISKSDARHKKMCLKIFVVVIPKEGWARVAAPITHTIWGGQKTQILKSQCHTKRRMGAALPANPSFGMTPTKTLRSVFSWHTSSGFP